MQNQHAAVSRRLSDPDFQAALVNKSISLSIGLFAVVIAFAIHDVYVWLNPPTSKYFFVDGKNPPHPVAALNSPIVNDAELLNWTVRSLLAVYNVNYHDYPVEFSTARQKFSDSGWRSFGVSYKSSGNFNAMLEGRLLCFAQAQRSAVITESTIFNGALADRIQVPIVQTCENTNMNNSQKMMLTALVVRTNAETHPDGLMIEQLVATAQ
jgi:intracellular multiplication protein IcmL